MNAFVRRTIGTPTFSRLVTAIGLLVTLIPLAAGGGAEDADTTTLSTYLQIDPASPQYEGHNQVMEAFAEAYPQITFEHEYATGEAFHQKFQAIVAANELPDVFTTYVGKRTAYVTESGKALDLRPYLTEAFMSRFSDATWSPQGPNGEMYTIPPSMAVTHAMYANTRILDELGLEFPETYQELLDQVGTIREAGYYPISMGNRDQWVVNSWLLSALVYRLGGTEWFDAAMVGDASFTDEPFVRSLEIIQELTELGVFSPGVNQMSNSEADEEFYQERSVYLIDAGWRTSAMVNILSPQMQAAIYMGVFPAIPGQVVDGSSAAVPSEGFGISADLAGTEAADRAFAFLAFYAGEAGASIRLVNGEVPTYTLDISDYEIPGLQRQYAEFSTSRPMGYVIDAKMDPEGMGVLNPDIQAMMLGRKTPIEVAERYEAWVAANDSNRRR